MHSTDYSEYLAPCCNIARAAGALTMRYFLNDPEATRKADNSLVTAADIEANNYIVDALHKFTRNVPIIAEEDEALNTGGHARFWLVDPLDGTRSFVEGKPEFTVNIALIENGEPVLGVIYTPPLDELHYASCKAGAWRVVARAKPERIQAAKPSDEGLRVIKSRSHPSASMAEYLETLKIRDLTQSGSSLKFCRIAEGRFDLYPRFGRTMEWDTAAGQAILEAAGGRVETLDGKRLAYGKPGFENPGFVAVGF